MRGPLEDGLGGLLRGPLVLGAQVALQVDARGQFLGQLQLLAPGRYGPRNRRAHGTHHRRRSLQQRDYGEIDWKLDTLKDLSCLQLHCVNDYI